MHVLQSAGLILPTCRIPDDCIDSRRYPLFMARAVLQALIEEHEQASKGARTP